MSKWAVKLVNGKGAALMPREIAESGNFDYDEWTSFDTLAEVREFMACRKSGYRVDTDGDFEWIWNRGVAFKLANTEHGFGPVEHFGRDCCLPLGNFRHCDAHKSATTF